MLVDHDVEPDLVAERDLVEIAVEQFVADLRIVMAVRQDDAQRAALEPFAKQAAVLAERADLCRDPFYRPCAAIAARLTARASDLDAE